MARGLLTQAGEATAQRAYPRERAPHAYMRTREPITHRMSGQSASHAQPSLSTAPTGNQHTEGARPWRECLSHALRRKALCSFDTSCAAGSTRRRTPAHSPAASTSDPTNNHSTQIPEPNALTRGTSCMPFTVTSEPDQSASAQPPKLMTQRQKRSQKDHSKTESLVARRSKKRLARAAFCSNLRDSTTTRN